MRLDTRLLLDLLLQLVVGKGEHPAIRVVDQDDLARAEQALGDGEGSDLVVRYDAAGVTYYVRVPLLEAEHPVDVEPGVHARDHRHALGRGQREVRLVDRKSVV